jgi:DtxR family transcriptional regulator, Mn-dependent transcriptional regulator
VNGNLAHQQHQQHRRATYTDVMRGVEDYLEEIKRLEEDDERTTATVVARTLDVSLPSASEMLKRLAAEGYLTREKSGAIRLTPEGRRLAHTILRRHRLVECLLVDKLGMHWFEVHGEAHKLEHAISARVEEAMAKALDYPDYCPHGHPICPVDLRATRRLSEIEAGEKGRIAQISEVKEDVLPYFDRIGIRPGAEVAVKDIAPREGPMTVETPDGITSLGREIARLVRVGPIDDI